MRLRHLVLLGLLVGAVTAYFGAQRISQNLRWETVSRRRSPDGRFFAAHLRSKDDGVGEAPYGDHIFLHRTSWLSTRSGELIFASYCAKTLQYDWEGNDRLHIQCEIDPKNGIPRQIGSTQGIQIDYEIIEASTHKLIPSKQAGKSSVPSLLCLQRHGRIVAMSMSGVCRPNEFILGPISDGKAGTVCCAAAGE